jgi:hypothetical protein
MRPFSHVILGFLFIIALHFIFPDITFLNLAIVFLSNGLVDADHYLYYVLNCRNFSLRKAYKKHDKGLRNIVLISMSERKKTYSGFYLFHGIEWVIVFFFLGKYLLPIFSFISWGLLFHWVVDLFHEIYIKGTVDKSSIIWNYFRFKNPNVKKEY